MAEKHLPQAHGALRRALLARRVDALWGLHRLRWEAVRAALSEPLLLADPRFLVRLVGSAIRR